MVSRDYVVARESKYSPSHSWKEETVVYLQLVRGKYVIEHNPQPTCGKYIIEHNPQLMCGKYVIEHNKTSSLSPTWSDLKYSFRVHNGSNS